MKLEVVGLLGDGKFHKAEFCAKDLHQKFPKECEEPSITGLLEFAWNEYSSETIKKFGEEMWGFQGTAIIFRDGKPLGTTEDLLKFAKETFDYDDFRPSPLYDTIAEDAYKSDLINRNNTFITMEITIGGESIGNLLIELFNGIVPKTCENFRSLCTGEKGTSRHNAVEEFKLHYKNTVFHRVVPNGWIQGGDIWYGKGNGGESIYGPTFEDENFAVSHSKRGILSMANKGRHTNASQFFFTLRPAPWMDTKYVAFGQIIEGTETLKKMESVSTMNERPLKEIRIADLHVLDLKSNEH